MVDISYWLLVGVVGTKIPHYSVFGETVEMASIMECSGEPMKIQISSDTKEHLKVRLKWDSSFSTVTNNSTRKI